MFLSNLGALAFELVLTRIFSVTLWYHLAFMVVTTAMFGVGAGGLVVYFLAGRLSRVNVRSLLADFEALKALFTALFVAVYLAIPFVPGQVASPSPSSIPVVAAIFLLAALPFFMSGMVNGACFYRMSEGIGRLYFADLAGAGAGVLLAICGLYVLEAPLMVLAIALLSSAAALLMAGGVRAGAGTRAAASAAALALILVQAASTGSVKIRYTKNYVEDEVYYEKWSPIARVTVIRYPLLVWGLGSRFEGEVPGENFLIEQDGAAGTPVVPAAGGRAVEWLDWDVTSAAFWILSPRSAAVIGSGGGKDIYSARRAGVERIVAVEINPDIVRVVQEEFAGLSGRPYDLPGVETRIAEGRSFLMQTGDSFDLIQLSMVDSWAATSAGAFMMSENHLYTREAFDTYIRRLTPGGAVSLSRYFVGFLPAEILRAFALAAGSLRRSGAQDPGAHLLLLKSGDIGTIIAKKSPLERGEEAEAMEEARRRGYKVVFAPSRRREETSLFRTLASPEMPGGFFDRFPIDIRPPVDDRPFFFFVLKPRWWLLGAQKGRLDPGAGLPQNVGAAVLVRNIFITAACFALLIVLIPLVLRGRGGRERARAPRLWIMYFAAIAAGFMFVEIPLIQKFILPLGHPVAATAAVLCTLLVSGGIGSYFWGRMGTARIARRAAPVVAVSGLLALGYYFLLGPAADLLLGIGPGARVLGAASFVAPAGFFMGGAFPMAVRLVGAQGSSSIPWLWAVNGAFSVMSSVLAMIISISLGFSACFLAAAAAYLLAAAVAVNKHLRTVTAGTAPR